MSAEDPLVDIPVRDVGRFGETIVDVVTFPDVAAKVVFCARLARDGVARSDVFGVGRLARALGTVEACHAWVRDRIRYANEPIEKLETPAYIASEGAGDCDGQAALLAAMVAAIYGSALLVPMGGTPDDAAHLALAVCMDGRGHIGVISWQPFGREAPAGYSWAETTVTIAQFGEIPIEAQRRAERTGAALDRPDLVARG